MKEMIRLGLVLMVFCIVAAFALGMVNEFTKETIEQNRIKANIEARKTVFPDAEDFNLLVSKTDNNFEESDKTKEILNNYPEIAEVFTAVKGGEKIGYVFKALPGGYGGAVEVFVGIGLDGSIKGVRVGNNQETPGLGAKSKTPKFYEQYNGLTVAEEVGVTKTEVSGNEIKAISGATITSNAVTKGVNYGKTILDLYK